MDAQNAPASTPQGLGLSFPSESALLSDALPLVAFNRAGHLEPSERPLAPLPPLPSARRTLRSFPPQAPPCVAASSWKPSKTGVSTPPIAPHSHVDIPSAEWVVRPTHPTAYVPCPEDSHAKAT